MELLPTAALRPPEIEVPSNRFLFHPLGNWLLPRALALGIPANLVSLAGLTAGVLAAWCYLDWPDWRWALAGWALMLAWHVLDGLDGAVARASGTASAFGRFIDGFSDYGVFVMVNLALVASLPDPLAALLLALAAGAAHAVQAAFYEARRATYVRRRAGALTVAPRPPSGGPLEGLYDWGERMLGNREQPFDRRLAALPEETSRAQLRAWLLRVAPRQRLLWPLSANARTHLILLACLAGNPALYWWVTLAGLSLWALAFGWWWQRAESAFP
ncbi:MAG: CDP-alcohol phosphatidyltransferase family protein [Sphingomonadaceae bacterium]